MYSFYSSEQQDEFMTWVTDSRFTSIGQFNNWLLCYNSVPSSLSAPLLCIVKTISLTPFHVSSITVPSHPTSYSHVYKQLCLCCQRPRHLPSFQSLVLTKGRLTFTFLSASPYSTPDWTANTDITLQQSSANPMPSPDVPLHPPDGILQWHCHSCQKTPKAHAHRGHSMSVTGTSSHACQSSQGCCK